MKYDYIISISITGTVEADDYAKAAKEANKVAFNLQEKWNLSSDRIRWETDILIPITDEITIL